MEKEKRLAILKRANQLFRQGKIDDAIKEYNQIIAIKPDDLEVRRIVGNLHFKQNNMSGGVEQFEWVAEYYLKQGFFAKAIVMYKLILRIIPNQEEVLLKLADLYTKVGLMIEARQIYLDLADEYRRQNSREKALDLLKNTDIMKYPGLFKKLFDFVFPIVDDILKKANQLFRQGKIDDAIKEYYQIISIKPDDLEVRRIVGDLYLKQNNTSGGVEQFEWIAEYYLKQGFFAKAIAMYKRILQIIPNYEKALLKLADLYTKLGLLIEAKQVYLDMAEECKRQGNQKKSLGMYKKILELDRQNIKMRTLLAEKYLKEGMVENAVEEYAIAADILLNKKDFRRAEKLLLTVLQKSKDPRLIEKLLYCYTEQNNDEKAISLLRFIIASNNSYLPAFTKLASLFKLSEKTNNLIALYVSLIPVYERKGMKDDLKQVLEELDKLTRQAPLEKKEEDQEPEDDMLLEISGDEKTSIEIDLQSEELVEEIYAIAADDMHDEMELEGDRGSDELMVLSDCENIDLEIEFAEPSEVEELPALEFRDEALIQSPSSDSGGKTADSNDSSGIEDLNLDNILIQESSIDDVENESPFLQSGEDFLSGQDGNKKHDQVICTVFSPPSVNAGSDILIQVFAHLYCKLKEAERMAQEFDEEAKRRGTRSLPTTIPQGTQLMFELSIKGIPVSEPIQTITWMGYTDSVTFAVEIPPDFKKKSIIGKIIISQDTIPIGMINFKIKIEKTEDKIKPAPVGEAKYYKYAFISYATEDRDEVIRRTQMLSLLKINYFQDILNLEPGSRWEKELYRNINKADVFFLFWSNAARKSKWVKKEISYAIERKQGDDENPPDIIPVIIEGPPVPQPPPELSHIHFNDKLRYFMNN